MAIVGFAISDFKGLGLDGKKLKESLEKAGVEVEELGAEEIKINVTPNRPDLLDYTGLVRLLGCFTHKKTPQEGTYKIKNAPALSITVDKSVKKARPYIAGIVAKNVDLSGNSLKYMINFAEKFADTYGRKRRKLAIGMHNLKAISGDLTYAAAEGGSIVALGSSGSMKFSEVIEKHRTGQIYGQTIPKHGKRAIYPFLKDSEKTIALIPITNCNETRVTETTKELFIDVTGISERIVERTVALLACSLIDMGAEVYPVNIKYQKGSRTTPQLAYDEWKLNLSKAEKTLGVSIETRDIVGLANKMGYPAAQYGKQTLFFVPPYRLDVIADEDIIEDIAIAYGYDKIQPLPIASVGNGLEGEVPAYENRIALAMAGLGYIEALNSVLTNEEANFEKMWCDYKGYDYVTIADAKTTNISMIRTDILPGLLQDLSISTGDALPQKLFEVGRVFNNSKSGINESIRVSFVSMHSRANFAEALGSAKTMLENIGISNFAVKEHDNISFIPGRCALIEVDGMPMGLVGELHPKVLESFGLEEPVVAAELTMIKELKYEV